MSNASPLSAVLSVDPDACHESRVWLATVAHLALGDDAHHDALRGAGCDR